MKIRIYHERKDEAIVLEVPDEECVIIITLGSHRSHT